MPCANCKNDTVVLMPCKVCQLIKNDNTVKRSTWCSDCQAYICASHKTNYLARGIAAFKNLFVKTE